MRWNKPKKTITTSLIVFILIAYIIEGYSNSMIYHKSFREDITMTLYFWTVTITIFILGGLIFKKLRPDFADVL
jgi:ABC-type polysaccharide/polyol phosphate export permease